MAHVDLLLRVLGVDIVSARRVGLEARNPFPWGVTVRYRGVQIIRG